MTVTATDNRRLHHILGSRFANGSSCVQVAMRLGLIPVNCAAAVLAWAVLAFSPIEGLMRFLPSR